MTNILSLNDEEFLKAISSLEVVQIVEEYRAYYNDNGKVLFYSANQFPEDGNWITIDKDRYAKQSYDWLWVIDGKLVERKTTAKHYFPLTKSDKGVKVVRYHANIVVEPHEEYSDIEYYGVN